MNRPANDITPSFDAKIDLTLEQCGWKKADQLWHFATDALMRRDYAEFDRLMREFRNISDTWTPRDGSAPNKPLPTDK